MHYNAKATDHDPQYGRIVDHENLNLSGGNYETRSSKHTDEIAKCRVEFERSYNYLRFVARLPELAQKSERLNSSHLLTGSDSCTGENIRASFALS